MSEDIQRMAARLDLVFERMQAALNDLNKRQMMTAEFAAKTAEKIEKVAVNVLALARVVEDDKKQQAQASPKLEPYQTKGAHGLAFGPQGFGPSDPLPDAGTRGVHGRQPAVAERGRPASQPVDRGVDTLAQLAAQMVEAEEIIASVRNGLGSLVTPEFRARMETWLRDRGVS